MQRFSLYTSVLLLLFGTAAQTRLPNLNAIGPAIGSVAPPFRGIDQFGRPQTLESLTHRDGLMLVFFRSADW